MGGGLEERLAMLRSHTASAKRRATLYGEVSRIADGKTTSQVTSLNHSTKAGKHMQKIGFIMMWIPEPTGVTCAVGGPMILAGRYLDKRSGGTLSDISEGTKDALEGIGKMHKSLI